MFYILCSYIIVKSTNIEQKMKIEEKKKLILEIMERQIAESKEEIQKPVENQKSIEHDQSLSNDQCMESIIYI